MQNDEVFQKEDVTDDENLLVGEVLNSEPIIDSDLKYYDIEIYHDICSNGNLLVEEVIACYEYNQFEKLEYLSDLGVTSFNILFAVILGYIAVKGLLDPWKN